MASSGFCFDFSIENSTEEGTRDEEIETKKSSTNSGIETVSNDEQLDELSSSSSPSRRPFVWVDPKDLHSLFLNRSQQEIVYQEIPLNNDNDDATTTPTSTEPPLRCVDHQASSFRLSATTGHQPENGIDIEPGVYEGGASVWECSLDLVRYWVSSSDPLQTMVAAAKQAGRTTSCYSLLELGCGHALPSCFLLRQALQQNVPLSVVLIDYNDFVLKDVTVSNLILNTSGSTMAGEGLLSLPVEEILSKHVQMGAGDWLELSKTLMLCTQDNNNNNDDVSNATTTTVKMLPRQFDMIVASETVYSTKAAQETADLVAKHLLANDGIAWIATKRYYFGVGGGSEAFCNYAKTRHNLQVETVQVHDNGAGNIREVLRVTRPT